MNDVLFPLPPASTSPTDASTIKTMMDGGAAHASNGGSSNGNGFQFPPPRTRTASTPDSAADVSEADPPSYRQPPPSAGPFRTSFGGSAGPPAASPTHNGVNGLGVPSSASPYTRSFSIPPPLNTPNGGSHARTRSVSAYAPAAPSPLSASFSIGPPPARGHARTNSQSVPGAANGNRNGLLSAPSSIALSSSLPLQLDTTTPSSPAGSGGSLPSPGSDSHSPSRPTHSTMGNGFSPPRQKSPVAQRAASGRHQRLHSRNLSIFFPRPGSLPTNTIAEDGAQELEFDGDDVEGKNSSGSAPVSIIPSAGSGSFNAHPRKLGEGFTFGAKPPSSALVNGGGNGEDAPPPPQPTSRASRRGHHHKHSVSHNFFSFLDPGANARPQGGQHQPEELITPHAVETPVSSLMPSTPFSAQGHNGSAGYSLEKTPSLQHQFVRAPAASGATASSSRGKRGRGVTAREELAGWVVSAFQLALGAWVWVSGQAAGSLALTGLGYWIVFDAFGIVLAAGLPGYLARKRKRGDVHSKTLGTMYGDGRVEALALFAQSVYLLFAAVYVCKESVEHMLLSFGQEGQEGHHHHSGDEDLGITGIPYPIRLLTFTFFALLGTAARFANHTSMVETAGNRIPSLSDLSEYIRSFRRSFRYGSSRSRTSTSLPSSSDSTSPLSSILSNPYTLSPLFFLLSIITTHTFVPIHLQVAADLALAISEAFITFYLAYPAAVAIGTVLLQTAPVRGTADGTMEAFLRAMREVERHPQVLHLPAPHIWQLTPARAGAAPPLVVTLELHVRKDMDDAGALDLTRWAWDRCAGALKSTSNKSGSGEDELEVTIGVVRG